MKGIGYYDKQKYRYKESIVFIPAFFINDNFRIGYPYDYSSGDLAPYSKGSHEIILLFDIPLEGRNRKFRAIHL